VVQNHWPAYKTQVAFKDLYWIQAWLMINSTEAYYSKIVCTEVRRRTAAPSTASLWWATDVKATGGAAAEEGAAWPFTWPLMRNWDHGVSRMTKVGYGNLTVNEGRQWEESGRFREKCVTSLLYDPLISDGRSGRRLLTFRSRFCCKFCDLYASIYGTQNIQESLCECATAVHVGN